MDTNQWNEKKVELATRVGQIIIPPDITPGLAKPLIARIDALYTEAMLLYADARTQDDNLSTILSNVLKTSAVGTNTDARSAAAVHAASAYEIDDQIVDLFDLKSSSNERVVFLTSIIKILDGKQSRLITANGLMKIESIF